MPEAVDAVEAAIASRRSVRGFLPDPVERTVVERLLALAARAPSGSNLQPWKAHVLTGPALARLSDELTRVFLSGEPERPEYAYYPTVWREPWLGRRRKVGWDLYTLAGVARGDREAGMRQRARNYGFFGAPVGMIFTIDRELGQGSWLDFGMFLQSLMIAARAAGLDTCPQAALANYPDIVARRLGVPDGEMIVCGMALGYADPAEPANRLVTERQPVAGFCTFHED